MKRGIFILFLLMLAALCQAQTKVPKGIDVNGTVITADQVKKIPDISKKPDSTRVNLLLAGKFSIGDTVSYRTLKWSPRVGSATSSATPSINADLYDIYKLTAQAADITSFTTNLSGNPRDGDIIEIQITGTAARAITWGTAFASGKTTLPTTTVSTTTLTVVFQYYSNSSYGNNKWICVNSF